MRLDAQNLLLVSERLHELDIDGTSLFSPCQELNTGGLKKVDFSFSSLFTVFTVFISNPTYRHQPRNYTRDYDKVYRW